MLALLQADYDRAAVRGALAAWTADAFEAAAAERGLVVAAMHSFMEWDSHPQGRAVAGLPPLSIEKIDDARPKELAPGDRPLDGVRVLELTRVIAGPVCGRVLAAHGADVLLITAPYLPAMEPLVIDTGRGKLSAYADLRDPGGRSILERLIQDADVFVQSYRPGALRRLGFGPQSVARLRPGVVYVSLSAYGWEGPWSDRRGFDSLVQTATGFNVAEAEAAGTDMPTPLPAQALDHTSGYLMALGAIAALHRRATVGGSWHVRASLAGRGRWMRSLGRIQDGFRCPDPGYEDVQDLLEETPSGFGRLTAVRHAAQLSETPARWTRPSARLGTHRPEWPERSGS